MKRTTIMLPRDLESRAKRHARDQGITLSELVRRALAEKIDRAAGAGRDPVFQLGPAPRGAKLPRDFLRNLGEPLLYEPRKRRSS